jgi:hypothetical protein
MRYRNSTPLRSRIVSIEEEYETIISKMKQDLKECCGQLKYAAEKLKKLVRFDLIESFFFNNVSEEISTSSKNEVAEDEQLSDLSHKTAKILMKQRLALRTLGVDKKTVSEVEAQKDLIMNACSVSQRYIANNADLRLIDGVFLKNLPKTPLEKINHTTYLKNTLSTAIKIATKEQEKYCFGEQGLRLSIKSMIGGRVGFT